MKKEGSGTIPARKLLDYVRLLPDADINIKFVENHWANHHLRPFADAIAGMRRESFPELPQMPEPIAEIPVKQLSSMIARTMFAISMEESRFTLNGALLLLSDEGMTMVATDGHRLAYVQQPLRAADGMSLPRAGAAQGDGRDRRSWPMKPAPMRRSRFAGDDNHLFFQFGDRAC